MERQGVDSARWLPRALGGLGALLVGLGVVFWVAANWQDLGRGAKFALLQALVFAPALVVFALAPRHAARAPLGLLAFIAIGALFAFFGQTYQTGADPWQLFAWWTLLGVPLVLAVRHDIVWMPWIVVVMTGVSLWVHARVGRSWHVQPEDMFTHLLAWAAAAAVAAAMLPRLRPWTCAGTWTLRLAVVLLLVMVTLTGVAAAFEWVSARSKGMVLQYPLALLVAGSIAYALSTRRHFDLPALSFAALAVDALLMAGIVVIATAGRSPDPFGMVFTIGAAAMGLLAGTVVMLMKLARERAASSRPREGAVTHAEPSAPDDATPDAVDATAARPWPVMLITAVGAWVATVPLLALVALLVGRWIFEGGIGSIVVGVFLLGSALAVLRTPGLALFVEQLMVPVLISGGVLVAFGLFGLLPNTVAALVMTALVLATAAVVDTAWLRVLLGMSAAMLAAVTLVSGTERVIGLVVVWHLLLAAWLAVVGFAAPGRWARVIDAVGDGWIVMTLLGLVHASGATFLLGSSLGWVGANALDQQGATGWSPLLVVSPLLAAAAMVVAARHWKDLRRVHYAVPAVVAVALAAFLPTLGATLLAGVAAARLGKRGIGVLAALAALWIVGSFYYLLAWPLVTKAIVMAAAGLGLAGAAWLLMRRGESRHAATASIPDAAAPLLRWGALITALLTIAAAQFAIRGNEALIANGRPVFVALAPVDPRSLMQGDYMALTPELPTFAPDMLGNRKRLVVARVDARGVARVGRMLGDGEAASLGGDELLIELVPKNGRWFIASDAWFFREGEGDRWARARFAEYRITPDGRALLVNLRGANLEAL